MWEELRSIQKQTGMRDLGGKAEAYAECAKVGVTSQDAEFLKTRYRIQAYAKMRAIQSGKKDVTPIKDICRWVKYGRFDDEPDQPTETLSGSDRRKAEAARRYLEESVDEDMEPPRSCEVSMGGIGQLDFSLLEKPPH